MFTYLLRSTSRRISAPHRKYGTSIALSPETHLTESENPSPEESPTPSEPIVLPPAPSKLRHNDLASYLSTTSASRIDTTYLGTKYEYTVQSSLSRLGFTLTHNGGSSDYGIDLLGSWTLPTTASPQTGPTPPTLKALIQCKSHSRPVKPAVIRELEGAFAGAPISWRRNHSVVAFLASTRYATKGVREAMGRSFCPVGFLFIDEEGDIRQMLWNRKAEDVGLVGVGVGIRYEGERDGRRRSVVELIWRGEPVGDSVVQPTGEMVGDSVVQPTGEPVGESVDESIGWEA